LTFLVRLYKAEEDLISKIIVLMVIIIRSLNVPVAFGLGMFLEGVGIPFASSPMLIVASNESSKSLLTYDF